jgi:hypothetical protein
MKTLADHVAVATRYARSANLERDAQEGDALADYTLTGRALEMLDRITATAASGAGGTWSVTGPYGSGKSSLGIFLDALFGPAKSPAFKSAQRLVGDVAPEVLERLMAARAAVGETGFARALVTAQTEPVTHTIARALDRAVKQFFGRLPSAREFPEVTLLTAALSDAASNDPRRTGPAPGSLVEVAAALARRAPLLIVIDEFGKNLEAARQRADADLYLLQLLAEAAQSKRGAPLFLITMQHLAFGEYAAAADTVQQREWAKIQGRFEDIVFVDSASQTRQLVSKVFSPSPSLARKLKAWAADQAQQMAAVNLYELADPKLLEACYPLHPLTVEVLPELCRRYGQNERTLFGFLTGSGSRAVPALLAERQLADPLPTIGLADVYDFFVETAGVSPSAGTTRWGEISLRLRDVGGLDAGALQLAKSVAVLNLIATNGPQRASRSLLARVDAQANAHLATLERSGVVVYRDGTDEYRVWQGTGLDLPEVVLRARAAAAQRSRVVLLNNSAPLEPAVAMGHSMRTDTLRTFERVYIADPAEICAIPPGSPYDGRAYFSVDPDITLPTVAPPGLPVVVQVPSRTEPLLVAATEVHALQLALQEPAVADDWVVRAELRERLAVAERELRDLLDDASASGRWYLLTDGGPSELASGPGSTSLSDAADRCYPAAVAIRNETLNRVELTSQGAKARRQLLLAMLDREPQERLGLTGFGPEVAMYAAVLDHTGVHRFDARHERWAIRPPSDNAFHNAWRTVEHQLHRATDRRVSLSDVYAALQMPPIGMKAGPIPVLVTAVLIATSDEVALYEHGTFRPVLTEEVCDRMVRNPGHFEIKHYANASGGRRQVIETLADALGVQPRFRKQRVGNVLAIVSALVGRIAALAPHTMYATNLSAEARVMRDAIASATEPDDLLFSALPAAVGLGSIGARLKQWRHTEAFASQLVSSLAELEAHYTTTLEELAAEMYRLARESGRKALAMQAQILEGEVINPELRSFVLALASESFDDMHWIENIATVITRSAPRLWRMDDRARFTNELTGKLASFRRLLVLHSEMRGLASQPFDAHRVTLTTSSGNEDAILVALDDDSRGIIAARASELLAGLAEAFGSQERAEKALLAWSAERVLPHVVTPIDNNAVLPTPKAVNDV